MQLISRSHPALFKHCATEFNVAMGCNTVRIGTLWGFRDEENELLRDSKEGTFTHSVKFEKLTKVSDEWMAEIQVEGGENHAHIDHLEINKGEVSVRGFTLEGSTANSWIFCVSAGDSEIGNISQAHPSKWKIDGENAQRFGNYMANLLFNSLTIADLPDSITKGRTLREVHAGLSMNLSMAPVEYVERSVSISSEENFPVERLRELKQKIAFMKPKEFAREREYRFVFSLVFENKIVSIADRPKILQLREIDTIVSRVSRPEVS